jgi:hypothetical protein
MSKPRQITCQNFSEIPPIAGIRKLATDKYHLVLQIPRSIETSDPVPIINELSTQLPNYSVIDNSITEKTIEITIRQVVSEKNKSYT